ncbi:hypothetical protein RZN38_27420, partial [Klebsiella pneumoniae]|nr:hypothetical protein [Klebsiella pneumoniae]
LWLIIWLMFYFKHIYFTPAWIGLHILPQDHKIKVQLCVLLKTGPDIMDDSTPLLVPPTKR